jgi:hypothetical protein
LETNIDIISEKTKAVSEQKDQLAKKVEELAYSYGWGRRKSLNTALLKLLSTHSCEGRIQNALQNKETEEDAKFDSYYRKKSEYATVRILDRLKTLLSANGIEALIQTEAYSTVGRYDAVISQTNNKPSEKCKKIRIEIKASLGLDFEQLGRYLMEPSSLILIRVVTGQVAKLPITELQPYVSFTLQELIAKTDRLLTKKCYIVPGNDCHGCQDTMCIYKRNKNKGATKMGFITVSDNEFTNDLTSFLKNISFVAEKTASIVIEELTDSTQENTLLTKRGDSKC